MTYDHATQSYIHPDGTRVPEELTGLAVAARRNLADTVARRRDQQLVALVTEGLAPYTGTVLVLGHRDDLVLVRVGGPGGPTLSIPVDRYAFPYPPTPEDLALDVARRARTAWREYPALDVPDNIGLGES